MQNRNNKVRPEYLYAALMCIAVALFIVILIICSSCEPNGEESSGAESSAVESSIAQTESDTSSEPVSENSTPVSYSAVEVSSSGKNSGILALTTLPADGENAAEPDGLLRISGEMNGLYGLRNFSLYLKGEAIDALDEMTEGLKDAKGENNLMVYQGYLSANELEDKTVEVDLTNGYTVMLSVYPADADGDAIGTGKFLWLVDNCNQYGYILRYPSEKSSYTQVSGYSAQRIYRYVGYEHAAYMGKYHLCLEEYLDALRNYNSETPLEIAYTDASGDERVCAVYYVPASDGEQTSIPIYGGEGTTYSISGNGSDGFIVTCDIS